MPGHTDKRAKQPYDLDRIVASVLNVITAVVVAGAMTWSTVAIGTLLHRMAPSWVSYGVAAVFDLSWVACMGAEWLMRYDPRRALLPKVAGWVALVVSVASIVMEGYLTAGNWMVGSVGAVVSILAKGLWLVVMTISAQRLAPTDAQWYATQSSAAEAQLAMVAVQRKLARSTSRANQERIALATDSGLPQVLSAPPSAPVVPQQSAVRPAASVRPAVTESVVRTDSASASVRQTVRPSASVADKPEDSVPETRTTDTDNVRSIGQARSLADFVRQLHADGLSEADIRTRVLEEFPDTNRQTLGKTLRRLRAA